MITFLIKYQYMKGSVVMDLNDIIVIILGVHGQMRNFPLKDKRCGTRMKN